MCPDAEPDRVGGRDAAGRRTACGAGDEPTVVVVDDHPLWRDALARDLDAAGLRTVGTAGSVGQALRVVAATRPDVLVLDLRLPEGSGLDVLSALLERPESPAVLVVSASGEESDVLAAVKLGAGGYLVKSASPAELVDAVRRTAAGQPVFGPGLAALVLGDISRAARTRPAGDPPAPPLTPREVEILRLVAKGLTARDVAARLGVSHRTVQNHVHNVLAKLQLRNRVELTRYALDRGLDEPPASGGSTR